MTHTKTRRHPVPRSVRTAQKEARASRKEIKFPIPGHALGTAACLVMRRKWGQWAILDNFRGDPAYLGAGEVWEELEPQTPASEMYRWSEAQARALMARFVDQATEIHQRCSAIDTARRIEQLAAAMALPEALAPVLTLHQVAARLREAEAEVAARAAKHAPVQAVTFTVPAAVDHPDYQPESPDPQLEAQVLSLKAQGISVNAEQETVPLNVRPVQGSVNTWQFPVQAPFPPRPTQPPTVHLRYLAEAHPDAGARVRESVAEAMAAAS